MEFYLQYHGKLKSNAGPDEKHKIRQAFHKQLKNLFEFRPFSEEITNKYWNLEFAKSPPENEKSLVAIKEKGGYCFAPIVLSNWHTVAKLDITMLWKDTPGNIVGNGGDIDNRLKTLFDALSAPVHIEQFPKVPPAADESPFYCLLEDDKLITDVSVKTERLLIECNDKASVSLFIRVKISTISMTWANMAFM